MAGLSPNGGIHVFWNEGMLEHDTGNGVFDTGMDPGFLDVLEKHPENSDRVRNMVSILKRGPISPYISWLTGAPALISQLLSFHTPGLHSSFFLYPFLLISLVEEKNREERKVKPLFCFLCSCFPFLFSQLLQLHIIVHAGRKLCEGYSVNL